MKTLLGLLSIAFTTALLPGQTRSNPEADRPVRNPGVERIERLSKSFPPEVAAATKESAPVTPSRSNCVYSSAGPGGRSLVVKRCETNPRLELFPAFKNSAPAKKPEPPNGDVR